MERSARPSKKASNNSLGINLGDKFEPDLVDLRAFATLALGSLFCALQRYIELGIEKINRRHWKN